MKLKGLSEKAHTYRFASLQAVDDFATHETDWAENFYDQARQATRRAGVADNLADKWLCPVEVALRRAQAAAVEAHRAAVELAEETRRLDVMLHNNGDQEGIF